MENEFVNQKRVSSQEALPLLTLEKRAVICLCGAGGKTTLLHRLADIAVARGMRTLLTTTTHMRREEGLCTDERAVREALGRDHYAFAGKPDPKNARKIAGPEEEELLNWEKYADITLIEADGAREKRFKVPYPWEPVIPDNATQIAILYSRSAVGMTIAEAAYNPEGVCQVLAEKYPESAEQGDQTVLTEEMMVYALEQTYVRTLSEKYPEARIGIIGIGNKPN